MKTRLVLAACVAIVAGQARAADTDTATNAINALGIDLLHAVGAVPNALLSPYSIQETMAMTYAGAAGKTREQMAAALHFPKEDAELAKSFNALDKELAEIEKNTRDITDGSKEGGPNEPVTISMANRLFAQAGFDFQKAFLAQAEKEYGAPVEQMDFDGNIEAARKHINGWVLDHTHGRIHDLIAKLYPNTRLVLVNAIYLKAAWLVEFPKQATEIAAFRGGGMANEKALMMNCEAPYFYAKKEGFTEVGIPYVGGDLQFLVLLPDKDDGLAALEKQLTPAMLADCAKLQPAEVELSLPKLKFDPGPWQLKGILDLYGMKSAFDDPEESADFSGIAPRKGSAYLYIAEIYHRAFLSLDEQGTEATAATAVVMALPGGVPQIPKDVHEVHVDHPYLFAIQDRKSGACLFLGRVTNPEK